VAAHRPFAAAGSGKRLLLLTAIAAAGAVFLITGIIGVYRYLHGFWLYRGFAPPHDPGFVHASGRAETIRVRSAAIGGRSQRVIVYLPPGYDASLARRYPVFYLLHGFPGDPGGFIRAIRVGVVEDTLLAEGKLRPMILVMPFGSTSVFTDEEWANGIHRNEGWETFVARDVPRAIDARYRTIPRGAARALGGLSEGGYASFNIGLHDPSRFHVLESWSGYEKADDIKSIFGGRKALLDWNSPLLTLRSAAPRLRRDHSYLWFYSGSEDRYRPENVRFASELAGLRIPHHFFTTSGGHDWGLWRAEAWAALEVASAHLAHD
jgi:enterochelin esterase family protein